MIRRPVSAAGHPQLPWLDLEVTKPSEAELKSVDHARSSSFSAFNCGCNSEKRSTMNQSAQHKIGLPRRTGVSVLLQLCQNIEQTQERLLALRIHPSSRLRLLSRRRLVARNWLRCREVGRIGR